MPIEIIDCEQRSPEWFEARRGIPTASRFKTILAKSKDDPGKGGLSRLSYMEDLAVEIISGQPTESYTNAAMDRGRTMEDDIREKYGLLMDVEPERVGFVRNGQKGCSPDSFIGQDGMLEIKTTISRLLVSMLRKKEFPATHKAQCQGGLWVCEREWVEIIVVGVASDNSPVPTPNMPRLQVRANRDEGYIVNLAREVERFNADLHEMVEEIRRYGGGP